MSTSSQSITRIKKTSNIMLPAKLNLICLYHNADRHRTAANFRAALPDMDKEMAALACQTVNKLDAMSDADFAAQRFHFTDE